MSDCNTSAFEPKQPRTCGTCGEEAPDELCGDFEWTDGR